MLVMMLTCTALSDADICMGNAIAVEYMHADGCVLEHALALYSSYGSMLGGTACMAAYPAKTKCDFIASQQYGIPCPPHV